MPICGSLPVGPNEIERVLPNGQCLVVPKSTPLATAPLYQQGAFVSANPYATISISQTDAAGRETLTLGTAALGTLGTLCTKNCGSGLGFFGLGGEAAEIARTVGTVVATIAPALTPVGPILALGSSIAQNVERGQNNMALNIGGLLGSIGGVLSGANLGDYSVLSQITGAGLNIAGAALAPAQPNYALPAPAQVYGPVYNPPPMAQVPAPVAQPTPVGAFGLTTSSVMRAVAPILLAIATKLGLRTMPTLRRAMQMIKKLAKIGMSPEAVAVALGITAAQLATLIVSDSQRKRRRMNPANSHALRRAARRIKSFHRLCSHTDLLKGRRRSAGFARCGTCKKSPCRC